MHQVITMNNSVGFSNQISPSYFSMRPEIPLIDDSIAINSIEESNKVLNLFFRSYSVVLVYQLLRVNSSGKTGSCKSWPKAKILMTICGRHPPAALSLALSSGLLIEHFRNSWCRICLIEMHYCIYRVMLV